MSYVIQVTTSMDVAERANGHIVIEGTGLSTMSYSPFRLAVAWEWKGDQLVAHGNLLTNEHIKSKITVVDVNGQLGFILPILSGEVTVAYLSPRNANVPNTGWTVKELATAAATALPLLSTVELAQSYNTITSELLVGMPIPWSSTKIPDGFLPYTGISFDKTKFPELAVIYPNGILQDLRGDFIRAAEVGRTLLSKQGDTVRDSMRGTFALVRHYRNGDFNNGCSGAFKTGGVIGGSSAEATNAHGSRSITFDPGPTSNEVRPRNVAFIFITKAG